MSGDITEREFLELLKSKNRLRPCPDCGKEEWESTVKSEGEPTTDDPLMKLTLPDDQLKGYTPVYVLVCGNCGHVKTYYAPHIESERGR